MIRGKAYRTWIAVLPKPWRFYPNRADKIVPRRSDPPLCRGAYFFAQLNSRQKKWPQPPPVSAWSRQDKLKCPGTDLLIYGGPPTHQCELHRADKWIMHHTPVVLNYLIPVTHRWTNFLGDNRGINTYAAVWGNFGHSIKNTRIENGTLPKPSAW